MRAASVYVRRINGVAATAALLLAGACGGGGGGGRGFIPWQQFRHDPANTALSEELAAADTGTALWSFEAGAPVDGTPAVDGTGTVFVSSGSTPVDIIDPTGALVCNLQPGVTSSSSSPLLADQLYTAADFGPVYALAANSCGLDHFFQTGLAVTASPNFKDGIVYVGSTSGTFYALDGPTMLPKWGFGTGGPIRSSAAIASDGSLRFGSDDGNLYAVTKDGDEVWQVALGGPVVSSPAIAADGTTYVGSERGSLAALGPDGSLLWQAGLGGAVDSSPALGPDGTIYVGSNDHALHALSPAGAELWRFTTGGAVTSSPIVSADGIIVVGSSDGSVYAVNADGSLRWRFATAGPILGSPAFGPKGVVYVGSTDGHVYAIT